MLNSIIRKTIQADLKSAGFKKKKLCWNKKLTSFVDVLTIQKSKGSTSRNLQFTLNIGIFVPSFYELVWEKPAKDIIGDADCVLRKRISPPTGGDWWNVSCESDVQKISFELKSCFLEQAFSFWDKFNTLENIYEGLQALGDWDKQYWPIQMYIAIAAKMNGNEVLSRNILDKLSKSENMLLSTKAKIVTQGLFLG